MTNSKVYNIASIDRRVVSKIPNNLRYPPTKRTVVAFELALRPPEAQKLVTSEGYLFSNSEIFNVITLFYIEQVIYELADVDDSLR
jgi:hypothetical protein